MDFKWIYAFLKIAETSSFTKAANELYITQSAISYRIQELEKELKTQLFERNHGNIVKLTPHGEKIYPVLKNAMDLINLAPSIVQSSNNLIDSFSMFFPVHMSEYIIPPLFEVLYKTFPQFNFSYSLGKSQNIIEDVNAGKVDIGFIYYNQDITRKNINIHHIKNEPTVLVASPNHPKKDHKLSLQDLQHETIIFYHKTFLTYVLLRNFFIDQGYSNFQITEIQNFPLIKKLVLEDSNVAFLQRFIVLEDLNNNTLVEMELSPGVPPTPIYVVARKNIPDVIVQTVVETAKAVFQ